MEGLVFSCFGTLISQTFFGFDCTKTYTGRFIKGTALVLLCAVALTYGEKNAAKCNCDPTKAMQICEDNYEKTDILVAHEYCNKFYLCISGKPFGYECPPSLLYDPYREKCDAPEYVDCAGRLIIVHDEERYLGSENWVTTSFPDTSKDLSLSKDSLNIFDPTYNKYNCFGDSCKHKPKEAASICSNPESNGFLFPHEKCNKFYKCDYNKPMEFTCHKGTAYNPKTGTCEWLSEVECGDRLMSDIYEDNTKNLTNVKNVRDNITVSNVDGGNIKIQFDKGSKSYRDPIHAPFICALPGSSGKLIAHEKCNKYYQCDNNRPIEVTCHNGTLYNPLNEKCDVPSKVDCGDRLITVIVDNASNDNGYISARGKYNETIYNYEKAASICASPSFNGTMIAHKSCNKFYKCDLGSPLEFTCPHGTLYNAYKKKCDLSNTVECGNRLNFDIYGDPLNFYNNNVDTNNGGKDNTEKCNCDPEKALSICANPGSSGILIAHKNCAKFYKCDHNIPVEFSCHKGTLYNPYKEKCDWSSDVKCGDRLIPKSSKYDDGNNNRYNDNASLTNAGKNSGGTNEENNDNRKHIKANSICAKPGSNGNLIAHKYCNKFYSCKDTKTVELTCPKGTVFNPTKQECDLLNNVECGDRLISETDDDISNDNFNSNNGGQDYVGTSNSGSNKDNGAINKNTNKNSGKKKSGKHNRNKQAYPICASPDSDGTLIAHKECNKFYKCINNKPLEFTCHKGTVFNPYNDKCDLTSLVECGDRLISETDDNIGNENISNKNESNDSGGNNYAGRNNFDKHKDKNNEDNKYKDDSTKSTNSNDDNDNDRHSIDVNIANSTNNSFNYNFKTNNDDKNEDGNASDSNDDGKNETGIYSYNLEQAYLVCASPDSNGTKIAHKECNKFYKCDLNRPIEISCPYGTAYNPNKEICDWSNTTNCGDRINTDIDKTVVTSYNESINEDNNNGSQNNDIQDNDGQDNAETCNCDPKKAPAICASPSSSGILIAHELCNKFYKCHHNKPVEFLCHKGTVYNPYKEICDWPSQVKCGDRLISETIEDTDNNISNENVVNNISLTVENETSIDGNNNVIRDYGNSVKASLICTGVDSSGTLVAHQMCNKFYKCDQNRAVEYTCGEGTLYDPYKAKCDLPSKVECGYRLLPEIDVSGSVENTSNNNGSNNNNDLMIPSSLFPLLNIIETIGRNRDGSKANLKNATCNCNPKQAPLICAKPGSTDSMIAHEMCNKYYKCDQNQPVELTCDNGTLYNPYKTICDSPSKVECGDRLLPAFNDKENNQNCSKNGHACGGNNSEDDVNGGNNNDKNDTDENDNCNCNPDLAPSICANPGSDGVMIAHEMCYKFYKCDHNNPVEFTCPNGTEYNPYKEICDWPYNVECRDRLPLVSDDTKINNHDDKNDVGSTNDNANIDNNGNDNTENNNDDTENPKEAPRICAKTGSSGIVIAHEKCNKFYKCDRNRPVEFMCPNATLYNSKKRRCDEPSNVQCGEVYRNEDSNNEDPNDEESYNEYSNNERSNNEAINNEDDNNIDFDNVDNYNRMYNDSGACNCNPEDAPAICAHPDSSDIMIAHKMCNQFYKCNQSKPVEFSCSSGLLYNPYKEKCDWPNKVECGDRLLSDFKKNKNNNNGYNTDGDNDNDKNINSGDKHHANDKSASRNDDKCNCDPAKAPIICAKPDSSGILIANKKCNKFYVCDQGKPVEFTCRGIELYDPYKEKCDLPSKVDCGDRMVPSIDDNEGYDNNKYNNNGCDNYDGTCNWSPEKALTICANPFSSGFLLAHKMCNKFYKCHLGKTLEFDCPKGMIYNPLTKQCDFSSITTCGDRLIPGADLKKNSNGNKNDGNKKENNNYEKANMSNIIDGPCNCKPEDAPLICANPDSNGILVAHEKCNKFYRCNLEKPVESTCPKNTLYNPYKEKCDWPNNVECGNRENPDSSDIDLPLLSILLNNDNQQVHNIKKIHDNPKEARNICAVGELSDGILIAHENCNQFYMCGNGTPIAFKCPQDTLYNPIVEKCDWGDGVECSGRIIPGTTADNNNRSIGYDAHTEDLSLDIMPNVIDSDHNKSLPICLHSEGPEIFIKHESCNKFYRCFNGTATEMQCGGDLLFNTLTDQCDWPINVDCGSRIKIETDANCACNPKNALALCARKNTDGKLIAHENCNQYYVCIKGVPMPHYCKNDLFYNIETEECDFPQNVDCSTRSVTQKSEQDDTRS